MSNSRLSAPFPPPPQPQLVCIAHPLHQHFTKTQRTTFLASTMANPDPYWNPPHSYCPQHVSHSNASYTNSTDHRYRYQCHFCLLEPIASSPSNATDGLHMRLSIAYPQSGIFRPCCRNALSTTRLHPIQSTFQHPMWLPTPSAAQLPVRLCSLIPTSDLRTQQTYEHSSQPTARSPSTPRTKPAQPLFSSQHLRCHCRYIYAIL